MAWQFWRTRPAPQEVSRLRHAVMDYAVSHGMEPDRVQELAIAVSEVVSNAVMHAYPTNPEDGTITVMARAGGDEVTVRVLDDGVGLRPRNDSPGAGLGLAIAGSVARRMSVERPAQGGTEVRMTFATTG